MSPFFLLGDLAAFFSGSFSIGAGFYKEETLQVIENKINKKKLVIENKINKKKLEV